MPTLPAQGPIVTPCWQPAFSTMLKEQQESDPVLDQRESAMDRFLQAFYTGAGMLWKALWS